MQKVKMKVLGIIGSPRKGGNTETIVDEILAGAKEAGAEIDKIILNDLDISPCQGCYACTDNGICMINDDMDTVNEKMEESSVFIYGTPVYYWGPTAQFKIFMDRCLATSRKGLIKNKKIIIVVPLGGSEIYAQYTLGILTDTINYQSAELFDKIISPSSGSAKNLRKDVLERAHKIGIDVVKS